MAAAVNSSPATWQPAGTKLGGFVHTVGGERRNSAGPTRVSIDRRCRIQSGTHYEKDKSRATGPASRTVIFQIERAGAAPSVPGTVVRPGSTDPFGAEAYCPKPVLGPEA